MMSKQCFNASIDDILSYDKKTGHMIENIQLSPDLRRAPIYDSATLLRAWLTVGLAWFSSLNHLTSMSSGNPYLIKLRQNLIGADMIPSADTMVRFAQAQDTNKLRSGLIPFADNAMRSGALRCPQVDNKIILGIDATERLCSANKNYPGSLERHHSRDGSIDHFFRNFCIISVGIPLHLFLYEQSCEPKIDSSRKDEGELTCARRAMEIFLQSLTVKPDIVVADALYSVSTFINAFLEFKIALVAYLKGDNRLLVRESLERFMAGRGYVGTFYPGNKRVDCYEDRAAHMTNVDVPVRVVYFVEYLPNGRTQDMLSVTTSQELTVRQINFIQHSRWQLEINGFRSLKTFFSADHCYTSAGAEQAFLFLIFAYNLIENYLMRHRPNAFQASGMTRQQFMESLYLRAAHIPVDWSKAAYPAAPSHSLRSIPSAMVSPLAAEPSAAPEDSTISEFLRFAEQSVETGTVSPSLASALPELKDRLNELILLAGQPNVLPFSNPDENVVVLSTLPVPAKYPLLPAAYAGRSNSIPFMLSGALAMLKLLAQIFPSICVSGYLPAPAEPVLTEVEDIRPTYQPPKKTHISSAVFRQFSAAHFGHSPMTIPNYISLRRQSSPSFQTCKAAVLAAWPQPWRTHFSPWSRRIRGVLLGFYDSS